MGVGQADTHTHTHYSTHSDKHKETQSLFQGAANTLAWV